MQARARRLLYRTALLAGAVCAALGAVGSTVSRSIFDPVVFGERAADSLSDPRVAAYAADRITDAVLEQSPDLTAVRPLILGTAEGLVTSEPMRGLVRASARSAHKTFFAEGTRQIVLSVPDVGILLRSVFERASPELAERIPKSLESVATSLEVGSGAQIVVDLWKLRDQLTTGVFVLFLMGPVWLGLGIGLAEDRRNGLVGVGVALLAAGLLVAAVVPLGSLALAVRLADDGLVSGAMAGLWQACLGGLTSWGLLIGGLGLLCAAGSTSLLEGFEPRSLLRRVGRVLVEPPASRRDRLAWAVCVFGVGLVGVVAPDLVLSGLSVVVGAMVALLGARELFRLLLESVETAPVLAQASATRRSLVRTVVVVGSILGLASVWLLMRNPWSMPPPSSIAACNGRLGLCDRRIDEVSFPAAHNAMSNAEIPDWLFPHHDRAIPRQLRDGVRGLLIDVHYGFPGASRIKTDLSGNRPTQEVLEHALGEEGLAAAMRIRERLVGADEGQRGLYLCHGFCEIGAYELVPTLREIRRFLLHRPGEVLILVVEDYVTPEDLAAAFAESGLADVVYRGPSGPPWPTLRKLVASGQNVLVFLESGSPGVSWLRPAFDVFQETPYAFHTPEEFSCRENRGGGAGSLFQINHWIETTPAPRPSNAELVNAHDFLLSRARQCQSQRSRLPNLLAVDFYGRGDLFGVVDVLNGLSARPETAPALTSTTPAPNRPGPGQGGAVFEL
jgi:hypothetical protein